MKYWEQQKQLLKSTSFQLYLCSCSAGTFASGLAYIICIWMVVNFHSSINATLIGMLLFWLPSLILSPYFGAIVDHYDCKKLIIVAELLRVIKFSIFGIILFYQPTLWIVYLLLALAGCFASLYKPLLPAFVHELVPAEQLVYANTNIGIAYELGNIVGRGIVTVVVLTFMGVYGGLFMIAALYFVSAVTMIPVKRYQSEPSSTRIQKLNIIKSIYDGYHYLFSNKELLLYALVQAMVLMSLMAAPVLVGPYVKIVLQADSKVFGISEAAMSAGAILGTFFWGYMASRKSKELCLLFASMLAGISYVGLASTIKVNYALLAFLLLGFSWGSFAVIISLVQMLTDKNYQGRVQAAIGAMVTIVFIGFAIFLYYFDKSYSAQSAFILLSFLCLFVFVGIIIAQKFNTASKMVSTISE